jgi:hypothetical protein
LKNTLNLKGGQGENCLPQLSPFFGQNCSFRFEVSHSEGKYQKQEVTSGEGFKGELDPKSVLVLGIVVTLELY